MGSSNVFPTTIRVYFHVGWMLCVLLTGRIKHLLPVPFCMSNLSDSLIVFFQPSVAQAYVNQRKLDHEVKTLQTQAAQFAKQTTQWISLVENFNQALKEIGDVENWARSIEKDMRIIATALEYVYKGQLQPSAL
ncbi:hypothetical protein FKM82_009258 [Ascaphus truei]